MSHPQKIHPEAEKIELLSDEVQEIFGTVPAWIVRWGVSLILLLITCFIAAGFLFRYPDIIASSAMIISKNPPASLVARTSGRIEMLSVREGENVSPGQILAVIENTANHRDVFHLQTLLNTIDDALNSEGQGLPLIERRYVLGSIQSSFSLFERQYADYRDFCALDILGKKIASMKQRIIDQKNAIARMRKQAHNAQQTLALSKTQLDRDSLLFGNGVIAASEFERSKRNHLQVLSSYQNAVAFVDDAKMELNQLSYQLLDLESQRVDERNQLLNRLREGYEMLVAAIAEWENNFTIVSPIEGRVTFSKYWGSNQYVGTGDLVFSVIPDETQEIVARLKIPVSGSGKVTTGQLVHIRLHNYPYTEFGTLEGRIQTLSLVPEETEDGIFYNAEVIFPNGLITNYNKMLPFSQQLRGDAEIVTNSLNLFQRFLNPLRAAWYRSV